MARFMLQLLPEGARIIQLPFECDFAPATVWATTPTIDSPDDQTGSVITLTPGTLTVPGFSFAFQWRSNGAEIDGQTGLTFTPDGAYNGAIIDVVQSVVGRADLIATAVGITITDPEVEAFPAAVTASLVEYTERRDPDDPLAGTGGRRYLTLGNITVPAGFTLRRSSGTTSGGTWPGNAALPNTTYELTNEYPVGTTVYFVLGWQRDSDSAIQGAFAPTGTTAGVASDNNTPTRAYPRALSAVPGNTDYGQLVVPIVGLENEIDVPTSPDWTAMAPAQVTSAIAQTLTQFGMSPSNNMDKRGMTALAVAYASFTGNTSADVRTLAQYRHFIGNSTCPQGHFGPTMIRNQVPIAFLHFARETPRLFVGGVGEVANAITVAEKAKADILVKYLLLVAAACCSTNHITSPAGHPQGSGRDMGMSGWAVNQLTVGANISQGPPWNCIAAACYIGTQAAISFLDTITVSSMLSQITAAGYSTSSNIYRCLNWRNEGVSDADAVANYARARGSTWGPTNTAVHAAIRNFRYGVGDSGVPLSDFAGMLYFGSRKRADRGWHSAFPYTNDNGSASGDLIGRVMSGIGGTSGNGWIGPGRLDSQGNMAGRCPTNAASTPHLGARPGMLWELMGRDEGPGPRCSMNYGNWLYRGVIPLVMSMELAGAIPHGNSDWDDELATLRIARDVRDHFADNGFLSYAHGGTKSGGAGGPIAYDGSTSTPDGWFEDINRALVDAVIDKIVPE